MKKIKTIVIEDEKLLRALLVDYIEKSPQLELVGQFKNALEGLHYLQSNTVDLLFLDIHMPELSGIELLESLTKRPLTVLTTAYSEYAIKSYELDILDYLLKPIVFPRFLQTVNKAVAKLKQQPVEIKEKDIDKKYEYVYTNPDYISIKTNHKFYKINLEDLLYMESQREYVVFHSKDEKLMAISSLKKLEEQLPANMFIRVHKSYIVSIKAIKSMYASELQVEDVKIPIGNSYRNKVIEIFEKGSKC